MIGRKNGDGGGRRGETIAVGLERACNGDGRRIKLNQVNPFQTKEIALNLLATILTQTS